MGKYMIREEGKNGEVEIQVDRIVRTRKKVIGRDDVQTIPIKAVNAVTHDRKSIGTDEVVLQVGVVSYKWKVKDAEKMVAELNESLFATPSNGT